MNHRPQADWLQYQIPALFGVVETVGEPPSPWISLVGVYAQQDVETPRTLTQEASTCSRPGL